VSGPQAHVAATFAAGKHSPQGAAGEEQWQACLVKIRCERCYVSSGIFLYSDKTALTVRNRSGFTQLTTDFPLMKKNATRKDGVAVKQTVISPGKTRY